MSRYVLVPTTKAEANEFVRLNHRHSGPVVQWKFGVGLRDESGLVGVAICGRPVARMIDQIFTIEVTRVCVVNAPHGASMLYGACCRAAKALGYTKAITYTRDDEPGTSLRAAGWKQVAFVNGKRDWASKGRLRKQREHIDRWRWEREL